MYLEIISLIIEKYFKKKMIVEFANVTALITCRQWNLTQVTSVLSNLQDILSTIYCGDSIWVMLKKKKKYVCKLDW